MGDGAHGEAVEQSVGERFAAGDERALRDAYGEWGALVFRLALRSSGSRQDAEDITQNVFIAAWRRRSAFDPLRGPLGGWLVGIARSEIADALTARGRADRIEQAATDAARTAPVALRDDALDDAMIKEELDRLEPQPRRVVELAYFGGLSHREIADELGLPLGTVKSHVRRSLERIRRDWGVSRDGV